MEAVVEGIVLGEKAGVEEPIGLMLGVSTIVVPFVLHAVAQRGGNVDEELVVDGVDVRGILVPPAKEGLVFASMNEYHSP